MSFLRGIADDLPLMEWLQGTIWPLEQKWISESFVRDGTELAIAEMLRGGVTCFSDMYFFPEITARIALSCGIRACIGLIVVDFPSAWASCADEYLSKGLALHDELRNQSLLSAMFAPHAPYSVSDDALRKVRMYSEELQLPVHMHVHETRDEIDQGLVKTGVRPLERLKNLDLLSPSLIAVHMTQLVDAEIDWIAEYGCHVVHCPESNLKLASGFCPVNRLLENGINVALGTDSAASNNNLDILGEMRTAALLAKGVAGDASAVPAPVALRMATLDGAKALGIDSVCGSLEAGKSADVAAVILDTLETLPVYDPISQIVYSANRDQVTDVWVAGRHLLKSRTLTTLDPDKIRESIAHWSGKLRTA
jgi:5-methylthioadenosine/S-adenosylhomocysteine deaminase